MWVILGRNKKNLLRKTTNKPPIVCAVWNADIRSIQRRRLYSRSDGSNTSNSHSNKHHTSTYCNRGDDSSRHCWGRQPSSPSPCRRDTWRGTNGRTPAPTSRTQRFLRKSGAHPFISCSAATCGRRQWGRQLLFRRRLSSWTAPASLRRAWAGAWPGLAACLTPPAPLP